MKKVESKERSSIDLLYIRVDIGDRLWFQTWNHLKVQVEARALEQVRNQLLGVLNEKS